MGKRRRSDANESEGEVPTTPSAKRACTDKWSFPDELKNATHLCQKLYDFLRRAKDEENRLLCECLVRVPSRRSHPQYYDVIKTPIDLMRIQQKLKTEEYSYVQDFLHDVRLLLENARSFYGEGSEEVACVDQLERQFTLRLQEYARRFAPTTSADSSPPSLTLRISKDHLQRLSSSSSPSAGGKTSQLSFPRGQARSKLTRSKAWLQEYLSSGDPLKMFLASVYEHTDSTGVCIAEVFHELPSPKDYPEYYEVITEPVDLNIIKKHLEEGRYSNLRDIQEDMILMIKNAHYFNEPSSDVYKFASVLRKFIISHCAELERKFHTVVPKPLKVSLKRPGVSGGAGEGREEGGDDEKKIPKLKVRIGSESVGEIKVHPGSSSEAGVKVVGRRLSQSSKTPDTEDESANSESSEDSSQSEEEGEGETVKRKSKISRGKDREDHLANILKSRNPPPLKKQSLALYHHLVRHRDNHGRQTAELFMRKPSTKMYPEYYIVIRSPIDFREISQKIKTEQYGSLEDVMKDVELLVSNATTFNEEDSTVYQDALTLQQLARSAVNRLQTAWPRPQPRPQSKSMTSSALPPPAVVTPITVPYPRPRGRPRKYPLPLDVGGAVGGASSIQSPISSLFMAIKMFTLQGRGLWRSLQNQPTVGSEARKEFSTISMKIATGKFSSVHQLYEELHQSLDHVCQTQPSDSLLHRDALILCRVAAKKYLELTADERATSLYPNVQESVQGMLRSILRQALQCPEAEGLRDVVVTREIQADGDEPATTHKLSLPLMEKWVERCCYRRLDSLQKDLLSILSSAAEQSTTLCQSAMAVGRAYIRARDAVVSGGKAGRLTSPALSYTAEDLEQDIARKMATSPDEKGVGPVDMATVEEEGEVEKGLEVAGSGEKFDELTVAGKSYHIGDVVYLTARNAGQKPHIVSIEKLWKDSSGAAWLQGCWFYRPEETFHLATRKFYEKEVFKSDFHSVAMLSKVQGPCCVLVVRDYIRSSPANFPDEDTFLCESRYAHKAKSFKKIKNWSYPPGRQPRLITRDIPLALRKVPSVFMTQSTRVKGSGFHSVVPVSDTVGSSDRDMELEAHGSDIPYPVQLENVKAGMVSNPTAGCTYYEQYCIDEDRFRLGDCVYVRSDQAKPFVARIDRMWTDANGDPWFHGPWFVYPEEINHAPTRLFLERELFMSNIHDTNPMRSIIGRCSVMPLPDYTRKRVSEFAEGDVFVVESRYLEAEGEIRKIVKAAALRPPVQSSRDVQEDEVFVFQTEIHPRKLPSPKLLLQVASPVTLAPTSAKPSSSLSSSGSATPVPTKSTTVGLASSLLLPTPPGGPQPTNVANVVNINPQLLQALLASVSQASSSKPVILPLTGQPPPISAGALATPTTLDQSSPQPGVSPASQIRIEPTSRSNGLVGYICLWDECGEKFENLTDLTTHLMLNTETTHLVREADGNFYCRWANCPRNPRHGGRTFDAMPKITRHVKEVHLLKLSQTALGLNPRSHVIQGQVVRPPAPSPPAPSPVVSFSSIPLPSNFASSSPALPVAHIPIITPPPLPVGTNLTSSSITSSVPLDTQQSAPSTAAEPTPAPVSAPSVQSAAAVPPRSDPPATAPSSSSSTPLPVSSIFVAPPEDKKPILHSAIYTKYIEGLQKGSKYSSSLQTTDQMSPAHRSAITSSQIQVSDWLLPSAIPPNMSTTEALLTLRDHLLRDSLRLGQHLEQLQ